MSFATGFASVALQVFVNTGMLNLINNKSLIFEKKKNLNYKYFILSKKYFSRYFFLLYHHR